MGEFEAGHEKKLKRRGANPRMLAVLLALLWLAPTVMAAPLISEFLALNKSGLQDEDGDFSDWIEIFNPGPGVVDLDGWRLTDSAGVLGKWRFPAVSLAPGEFLTVFASGKNRAVAGNELHTNFQLDADGEYLALVRPDATTVEHAYSPEFPQQVVDISYGLKQTVTELVAVGDTASYHVPDAGDAAVDFTPSGFNDAAWGAGPSGFGFGAVIPTAGLQAHWTFDADAADSAGTNHGAPINGASITGDAVVGPGALALDGANDCVTLGDPPSLQIVGQITIACWVKIQTTGGLRNIVAKGHTTSPNGEIFLRLSGGGYQFGSWNGTNYMVAGGDAVADAGVWTHVAGTFDGATWNFYHNGQLRNSNTVGTGALPVNEGWAIGARGTGTERFFSGSIDDVFIYDRGLLPAEIAILADTLPSGATTPVNAEMLGINTSLWLRHEFTVADPTVFDLLDLNVKYEDGFVAWLNGVEVARQNAPAPPAWNSAAASDRLDSLANTFERLSIADHLPALTAGANVLAIQALNDGVNDGSFLIAAELLAYDLSGEQRYFDPSTPQAPNGDGFLGFVADVAFSRERGFFDAPFAVSLSTATPGAEIRYTTDGSQPAATHGAVYGGPVAVAQTTPLRAAAFLPGWHPSTTGTNTYIFLTDVIASGVMDTGITQDPVYGPQMRDALTDLPTISLVASDAINAVNEAGVSMEWILPDGAPGFQEDAGVRYYGGNWAGPFAKQNFRLYFRGEYGATKLRFPLFAGHERGIPAVDVFDQLELRAGSHDMVQRGFYMSNRFTDDTMLDMGNVNPHGRFIHLYLNGVYWGQYHLRERWNADMLAQYLGGAKEDYEAINGNLNLGGWAVPGTVYDGDGAAWDRIKSLRGDYLGIQPYLDVPHYIDFMIMFMFGNAEAEYRCVGPVTAGSGFKWFYNDADGYLRTAGDRTAMDQPGQRDGDGPGSIFSMLFAEGHFEYKMLLADRIHQHYFNDGAMTPAKTVARLLERCAEVERAFIAEAARWGYRSPSSWESYKINVVNNVLPPRTAVVISQFRAAGFYPGVDAPAFQINGAPQHGGIIVAGDALSITNPNGSGAIYFTLDGTDPRQAPGVAAVGAIVYAGPVALTLSTRARAAVLDGLDWSALNDAVYTVPTPVAPGALAVTELHYNPAAPTAAELAVNPSFTAGDFEFLELQSRAAATLDLAGVAFTDGVTFTFPAPSLLAPAEYAVVARNRAAFEARYGAGANVMSGATGYSGQFNNDGETVRLENVATSVVLQFEYDDARGWPPAADGGGHSLVPLDWTLAAGSADPLYYGRNWRPSAFIGGSPGAADPAPPAGVVLNELAAHTDTGLPAPNDSNDWVEIFNPTASPITLNEYFLSDDVTSLTKWAIPNGTLVPAHGRVVFDEASGFHNPRTQGFGLNKAGEQLVLSHLPDAAIDRVVDSVRFKGQEHGSSLGRLPDGAQTPAGSFWYPLLPTPDAPNAGNQLGVVLGEVMYHPGDGTIASEYLELYNPAPTAAPLWNATGAWRIGGGVSFDFPPGATVPGGGRLLLVSFDPADTAALDAFKAAHGVTVIDSPILGPYAGNLSNRGERVALERPQAPDVVGESISWVIADELIYFEQTPFPAAADGIGLALHRVSPTGSGNDPANWVAAPASFSRVDVITAANYWMFY